MKRKIGVEWLAKQANVSIGTVDRALHARAGINPKTKERIIGIARAFKYRPNLAARALAKKRPHIRIAVCVPQEAHSFYGQIWDGIYDQAGKYHDYGVDFIFRPFPGFEKAEIEAKRILDSGLDGLILTPGDPASMTSIIDAAEDKGIRVLCLSSDAPSSKRSGAVCVEPRVSGLLAGEVIGKSVPAGSRVVLITERSPAKDLTKNAEAFSHSFTQYCAGGKVVEILEIASDPIESFRETLASLDRIPDLSGVYANTLSCLPICKAVARGPRHPAIKLVTTGLTREMIPYFEKLTIFASIHQAPYQQGLSAVSALVEHLSNDATLSSIHISPLIAFRSNLHLFRETGLLEQSNAASLSVVSRSVSPPFMPRAVTPS